MHSNMKSSPVPKSHSKSLKKQIRAGGSACQKSKSLQKRQFVPLHMLTHLAFSLENGSQNFFHQSQNNRPQQKKSTQKQKRKISKQRQKQSKRKQLTTPKIKNFINHKLQKRLESYYLFLALARNTLHAPIGKSLTENRRYTIFVGKGNNSKLIKRLFYSRHWWDITNDYKSQNINLIWTQWSKKSIFSQLQTYDVEYSQKKKTTPSRNQNNIQQQDHNAKKIINKIICQQQTKKTTVFNQFNYLLKTKQRDYSKSSFVETQNDVKTYLQHLQSQNQNICSIRSNVNRQSTNVNTNNTNSNMNSNTLGSNTQKNIPSAKQKQVRKKRYISLTCNHVQGHQKLTDKKNLLFSIQQYCMQNGQDCFEIVPLSFNITGSQQQFTKLQQIQKELQSKKDQKKPIWIMKPGQKSNRGNGIKVFKKIQQIKQHLQKNKQVQSQKHPARTYIIQKYIYPALYHRRKFDIRCFILIVASPLISAYFYNDGYLRTSSKQFKDKKIDDKFMHLTNDAIQKKGNDYGKYEKGNKITFQQYQSFLDMFQHRLQINFKRDILPKLKLMAAKSIAAGSKYLNQSKSSYSFELLGYDFMIDQDYRPWLIQVNTNPCLETGCPVLDNFIPSAVNNAIKIAIDSIFKPPKVGDWHLQQIITFPEKIFQPNKYQLIFQQQYE